MYSTCNLRGAERVLDFDPTESSGFLVGRIAHALKLRVQDFLKEADIPVSAEEISILTVLAHLDEPIRMKALAEKCGRDATTVSRQVAGLEAARLARRNPSDDDGRSNVVCVTPRGVELVERTIPLTLELRKQAMHGISREQAKNLQRSLMQMLANLS